MTVVAVPKFNEKWPPFGVPRAAARAVLFGKTDKR
jgi:hypothetical protein